MTKQLPLTISLLATLFVSALAMEGEEEEEHEETLSCTEPDCTFVLTALLLVWPICFGILVAVILLPRFHRRRVVDCDVLVQAEVLELELPSSSRDGGDGRNMASVKLSYEYSGKSFVAWEKYKYTTNPNYPQIQISLSEPYSVYVDPLRPKYCILEGKQSEVMDQTSPSSVICVILTYLCCIILLDVLHQSKQILENKYRSPYAFPVFLLLSAAIYISVPLCFAALYGFALRIARAYRKPVDEECLENATYNTVEMIGEQGTIV